MNSRKAFTSTIDRTLSTYLVTLASLHSLYQSQKHKNKSDLVKCQAINLTLTFFFWTYFFFQFLFSLELPNAEDTSGKWFTFTFTILLLQTIFFSGRRVDLSSIFHITRWAPVQQASGRGVDLVLSLPPSHKGGLGKGGGVRGGWGMVGIMSVPDVAMNYICLSWTL